MHLTVPDPNPGRCQNLRSHRHPDGHIEMLRCLDYEGTQHTCRFPEPESGHDLDLRIYTMPATKSRTPQPWKRPF